MLPDDSSFLYLKLRKEFRSGASEESLGILLPTKPFVPCTTTHKLRSKLVQSQVLELA